MSDYVFILEEDGLDSLYVLSEFYAFKQTGVSFVRKVDLAGISGHYELCVASHSRQEHLELSQIGVLGFIQNHAGAVKRAASHVGEGSELDGAFRHEFLKSLWRDHVSERIIQRLEVWVKLVLEVSRQEAQTFSGFNGWPRQDDPLDLPVLQCSDS